MMQKLPIPRYELMVTIFDSLHFFAPLRLGVVKRGREDIILNERK
jgi:hypothetical protein